MEIALEACRALGPQGINVLFEERELPFFRRFGFRIMRGEYLDATGLSEGSKTPGKILPRC